MYSPTVDMVTLYCTVLYCTVLYCTVLTDGGHGDHEEVDTVPVGEALAVLEVGRVTGVLELQQTIIIITIIIITIITIITMMIMRPVHPPGE